MKWIVISDNRHYLYFLDTVIDPAVCDRSSTEFPANFGCKVPENVDPCARSAGNVFLPWNILAACVYTAEMLGFHKIFRCALAVSVQRGTLRVHPGEVQGRVACLGLCHSLDDGGLLVMVGTARCP